MDSHSTVMSRRMLKLPVLDFDPVKLFVKELEVRTNCPFLAYTLFFDRIISQNLLYFSMTNMVETTLLSYGDLTYVHPIPLRYYQCKRSYLHPIHTYYRYLKLTVENQLKER